MKLAPILALFAAAASFTLTGCDKKPATGGSESNSIPAVVDEKTAIENFKTEVEGVGKWIEEKQKAEPTDPMVAMGMMGEVIGKIKGIKTDGLPADLKGAWNEMGGVLVEMREVFKGMPTSKPEDPMKALMEIMPKMQAVQAKMEPAGKKLEEIGKKYGLDLSKIAQPK